MLFDAGVALDAELQDVGLVAACSMRATLP